MTFTLGILQESGTPSAEVAKEVSRKLLGASLPPLGESLIYG